MTEYDDTDTRPETYRRRLLELADVTEKAPNFCYDTLADEVEDNRLKCGSAGCMLGWATTIPEAFDAGLRFLYECFTDSTDRRADAFYGITMEERDFLFYADLQPSEMVGHVPDITDGGKKPMSECTAKECADMLRAFTNWKYPAAPEEPAPKPKRVEKEGSKRWCAAKLREAAKWIEEHGWVQGNYFRWVNSGYCGCAHGGIAAVANKTCQKELAGAVQSAAEVVAEEAGAVAASAVAPPARSWTAAAGQAAEEAAGAAEEAAVTPSWGVCPSWVTEKHAWLVHFYAHLYGATFAFNDTPGRTKEEVCSQLRAAAYAVEHGGKMPKWAPTEKAKYKVAA